MKTMLRPFCVSNLALSVFWLAIADATVSLAQGQVPGLLNYQGRVLTDGTPFNGTGQFKFALVNGDGSVTHWSNDGTSNAGSAPSAAVGLPVVQGNYTVLLGDTNLAHMTAVSASVFTNADVRLRVWFNDGTHGFELLAPDQRIAAVGYALVANVLDGSVTAQKLADGAVTAGKLGDESVTSGKLADGSVGTLKITDGSVTAAKLADGAVTGVKLADGSVTAARLADGAVGVAKIADGSVVSAKLSNGAVTADKLAAALDANLAKLNSSPTFAGTISAAGFKGSIGASQLTGTLDDALLSANIPRLDGAGSAFAGNLTAQKFFGNGSGLTHLSADSMASGTIPDARLSGNVVRIDSNPKFTGTVEAPQFIGSGAGVTNVDALTLGGKPSGGFWQAGGNAGTVQGTHFLGTVDNQPFELRVNNKRAMVIRNDGFSLSSVTLGAEWNEVTTAALGAAIGGGGDLYEPNRAASSYSTIAGGRGNMITDSSAFTQGSQVFGENAIGGGRLNTIYETTIAVIGGGQRNEVRATGALISGGFGNHIFTNVAEYAVISGGKGNAVGSAYGSIAGGSRNLVDVHATNAAVGGGYLNVIRYRATTSVIAGGEGNEIQEHGSTSVIGGGAANQVRNNARDAFLGGGRGNVIDAYAVGSTLAGGMTNHVVGDYAVLGGGRGNRIFGGWNYSTISGGLQNTTDGYSSAVGGGEDNFAQGNYSVIPGGVGNHAVDHSMAAGRRAKAIHPGSFVWGDSTDAIVATSGADQFVTRAKGGYGLYSSGDLSTGVFLASGGGAWLSLSDRNAKENVVPTDAREVLDKVSALPMATWNYKTQDKSIRHIGPMAQDFAAAFQVGESQTAINTVDADGVALAAIQGLNQKLEAEVKSKDQRIGELETRLAELEKLVRKAVGSQSSSEGSEKP